MKKSASLIIRPYCEADRPFLRTLYLSSRRNNWHWLAGDGWKLEDFDPLILGEQVWVAMAEQQRAGFAAWSPVNNFLHSLFVSPQHQGTGVGSALLQQIQQQFTATGSLKCMLENRTAHHFYLQHGWQDIARGEGEEGPYILMHYLRHHHSDSNDAAGVITKRGS
ncbi:GNAT family N-acetyltransferase [Tatumella citrea]|uniref:GCN5 family acetyltransferase n=1 Tax=Tatumella citrea TaxID=53336 RepID=A0A1Y0LMC4_TATCI|nr:GNAT family N-acetyltransferase [Tatumella citrea]ARU94651.1 GCN5 family acetyltransferase [Tatumella citrea]ARU98688.1 GCN5 family acetyltransferase [Tatumella citrea]